MGFVGHGENEKHVATLIRQYIGVIREKCLNSVHLFDNAFFNNISSSVQTLISKQ